MRSEKPEKNGAGLAAVGAVALVLAVAGLGGCASGGSGGNTNPTPQASGTESWRPAWWIDAPVRKDGTVTVAAMGDGPDLLAARQAAIKAGMESLREALGGEPKGQPETKADSVRLPGGKYRAFVLVSGEKD